jgi:hypothetical protein
MWTSHKLIISFSKNIQKLTLELDDYIIKLITIPIMILKFARRCN